VNGVAPVPGPTNAGGFFTWKNGVNDSEIGSHSYAVTAAVTNTVVNQVWPIVVNISCVDKVGTVAGCAATSFLANLDVNVYTP
jgi:hypothetical protein